MEADQECIPLVKTSSPVCPVVRMPKTSLWPVSPISTYGQPQSCQPVMESKEAESEMHLQSGVRNRTAVDMSVKVNSVQAKHRAKTARRPGIIR